MCNMLAIFESFRDFREFLNDAVLLLLFDAILKFIVTIEHANDILNKYYIYYYFVRLSCICASTRSTYIYLYIHFQYNVYSQSHHSLVFPMTLGITYIKSNR